MSALVIFDIDDTLFRPVASVIKVFADGRRERVRGMYDPLGPGESYDFTEFESSKIFTEGEPIDMLVVMASHLIEHLEPPNRVVIVTARGDMDDRDLFLDKFRRHGIDVDRSHVYRAGNHGLALDYENKRLVFGMLLSERKYDTAICFDDRHKNIEVFMSFATVYNSTRFIGVEVDPKTGRFKETRCLFEQK